MTNIRQITPNIWRQGRMAFGWSSNACTKYGVHCGGHGRSHGVEGRLCPSRHAATNTCTATYAVAAQPAGDGRLDRSL